jgi:YD repeat-containing protein
MIRGILIHREPVILLLVLLISLVRCNKNNLDPDTEFRIIQVKSYYNDILSEVADVRYSGERVILVEKEIPPISGWPAMYSKTEVNYPHDDSIVIRNYYLSSYGFWDYESMVINEFLEGKIIRQSMAIGGLEKIRTVYEYQYSDNHLSETIVYVYDNPDQKITFQYNGSDLVRRLRYNYDDDWVLSGRDSLFYNGDDIDSLISYAIIDGISYNDYKYVYLVEDGLVTVMDHYDNDSASWRLTERYEYTYDSYRKLTSKLYINGGTVYKTEYYYEVGRGNYWQIFASPQI